jgi:hypothetical protein
MTTASDIENFVLDATGTHAKPGSTARAVEDFITQTPVANVARATGHALGLDSPRLVPRNPAEQYGFSSIASLPPAAAAIATGGASEALPILGSTLASANAAEAVHQLAPDNRWLPPTVAVLTGILGYQGLKGIASLVQTRQATKALAAAEDWLQKAKTAVEFGNGAGSPVHEQAQTLIRASQAKADAVKATAAAAQADAEAQTQKTFEEVAQGHGSAETHQQAGQALKEHASKWLTDETPGAASLPNQVNAAWAPVDASIPKTLQLPLSEFSQRLQSINKAAGDLEPVNALLKPALPAKLQERLASTLDLKEEAGGPPTFSWEDARTLRSSLGGIIRDPGSIRTLGDIGAQNAKSLYQALTQDLRAGADKVDSVNLFDRANEETSRLYDIAQGPIAKVVDQGVSPEHAASSLLGKNRATDLGVLRKVIPGGVDELAAGHLRETGKWRLLSPPTQEALVPDSFTRARLDTASDLASQVKANSKEAVSRAQADHESFEQSIKDGLRTGDWTRSNDVWRAQKARDAAKALLPPEESDLKKLSNRISSGLGALLGAGGLHEAIPHFWNALGLAGAPPSGVSSAVVGGALGLTAPSVARYGKSLVEDPLSVRVPLAAGAAGENTLAVPARPEAGK